MSDAEWTLEVFVPGQARPQGSKKSVGNGRMVESSRYVGAWRDTVAFFAHQARPTMIDRLVPVVMTVEFVLPRPTSTPKRSTPPAIRQPDVDKCLRAIFDALTGVCWVDDAQVVDAHPTKRLAEIGELAGCHIKVGVAA